MNLLSNWFAYNVLYPHWKYILLFMTVATFTQGNLIGTLLITGAIRWGWGKISEVVLRVYDERRVW